LADNNKERFPLCESCAERQGDETQEFGPAKGEEDCFICRGLTSRFPEIERSVVRRARGYQFRTFSIGVIIPAGIQEREDQLRSDLKIRGRETIKTQLGRGISDAVRREMKRKVDRQHPDITVLVDLQRDALSVTAKSIFVYGRYTKPPGISQRRELCERCKGRGCQECQSGYRKGISVEEILEDRLGRLLHSTKAKFTWLGSEDPESTVFPPGRPFIAEVKDPRKRQLPTRLSARTGSGMMKVTGLKVLRGKPTAIPSFTFKTRAFIQPESPIEEVPAGLAKAMKAAPIQFRNNKGKTVHKKVYSLKVERKGRGLVAEIKLDGGLPVKRLISGGSVSLSLAELFKTPLGCQRFDILRVWESGGFKFGKI
jgi:tRNA pseudouridine synthase 10